MSSKLFFRNLVRGFLYLIIMLAFGEMYGQGFSRAEVFRRSHDRFYVDMDGDGHKDFVTGTMNVGEGGTYEVRFYKNNGKNYFRRPLIITHEEDLDNRLTELEVSDFDEDGEPEIFLQVYNDVDNKTYSYTYKMMDHPTIENKKIFYRHSMKSHR